MKEKTKKSRKQESSSSSSNENTPPRHKKQRSESSKKEKEHSHHRKHSPERRRDSTSEKRRRVQEDHHRDRKKDKHVGDYKSKDAVRKENRDRASKSPPPKIKKEEEFDRRQEELRRSRRDNERRRENRHENIRVKQEPDSDVERRRPRDRDREHGYGGRHRQRDDIEKTRRENDARRAEAWQKREREGGQNAEALIEDSEEPKEKEKPNLGLSGALTEDTNTFRGVVIKYSEPPEARIPSKKWRLYPFKGDEALKVLHLHRQSAYLLGKLRRIADVPIDHPSCSKQHAILQFRMVEAERADGRKKRIVKPYILDLDSANGTFVNNQKIAPRRYVELKEKDVLKFAFSSREYVLIHDKSDTTEVNESDEDSEDD